MKFTEKENRTREESGRDDVSVVVVVAHDAEQPDEQVCEVQVDRQGAVDRIVDCALDVLGAVEVEDDVTAEEEDAEPVQPRQRALHRKSEEAGDGHEEAREQEQHQTAEEEGRPALEGLGDDRTDDAQDGDHRDGDREDLHHRGCGVERDDGSQHEAEGDGHHRVAQEADHGVLAEHRREDTNQRDEEGAQQELPCHGPVQAHVGGDGGGGDARPGPAAQQQVEGVAAEGVVATFAIPDGFSETHDGSPCAR